MKPLVGLIVALALAWLGLWFSNTGLLVYSSDTGVLKTRDCRYLVGVTIVRRLAPLAERCTLLRRL